MSELIALGDADAAPRWIGVRRHHVVLLVFGVTILADAVLRSGASIGEVGVGLACVGATVPGRDGLTTAEWVVVSGRFIMRRRFQKVVVDVDAGATPNARRTASFSLFTLVHRGRLDLSGADGVLASSLIDIVDSLAVGSGARHVSIHLVRRATGIVTTLALPSGHRSPAGWTSQPTRDHDDDAAWTSPRWCLERWGYLRTSSGVLAVLRVTTFGPTTRSLLEVLQHSPAWAELSLHVDVVAGAQAQRLAARAVHASRSDAAATSSVGFRRTARSSRRSERTAQREEMVANGRALLRLGAYAVVTAPDVAQLRLALDDLRSGAQSGGIRCQRGGGRQLAWWRAQLPGGTGW